MIGAMTSLRFVGASAAFIVCRHSLVGKRSLFASDRQSRVLLGLKPPSLGGLNVTIAWKLPEGLVLVQR